jgi:hypothetical protein
MVPSYEESGSGEHVRDAGNIDMDIGTSKTQETAAKIALSRVGVNVKPLPRATADTAEELRRHIHRRAEAVLFRGLTDQWTSRMRWTPDELRRGYGRQQVKALMDLPRTGILYENDQRTYERTLAFGDFLDAMTAPDCAPCYLAYQRAGELFDDADLEFLSLLGAALSHGTDTRFWIGSAATRSMLHVDLKDNLFCQFYGEKEVTLLPGRDIKAAYPFHDNIVNSQIDVAEPDISSFSRLRRVSFYSGVVQPGDVLYIPRGCWHDIRSRTPSVSVNHWFGPPQPFSRYMMQLAFLGPRYWWPTVRDAVNHGLLKKSEETRFFFSPPSTGKRLYNAFRSGDFSKDNDPAQ